jgi:hypothetical protein
LHEAAESSPLDAREAHRGLLRASSSITDNGLGELPSPARIFVSSSRTFIAAAEPHSRCDHQQAQDFSAIAGLRNLARIRRIESGGSASKPVEQ